MTEKSLQKWGASMTIEPMRIFLVLAVLVGCGAMSKGWLEALTSPALKDRVEVVGLVDIDLSAATTRNIRSW